MNTVHYTVVRPNNQGVFEPTDNTIQGVYNVRITTQYYIVEYFDGKSHHTRNIPIMLVEKFEVC